MRCRLLCVHLLALMLLPTGALARAFPDVPQSHPHRTAIGELSDRDVISGNPDGTYRPDRPVNRAEMLMLLYRASGRTPASAGRCFRDVIEGSWYAEIVCDAEAQSFVSGYADGNFRPEQAVTRAEALKMTFTVMGLTTDIEGEGTMYEDVLDDDWFAVYVRASVVQGILPIPGQEGPVFAAGTLLDRGEAAAYIWNAVRLREAGGGEKIEEIEEIKEIEEVDEAEFSSVSSVSLPGGPVMVQEIKLPFSEVRTFGTSDTISYQFTTTATKTVDVTVTMGGDSAGAIGCRLYLVTESGVSEEYYIGYTEQAKCFLKTALRPGTWMLKILSGGGVQFRVDVREGKGDGNDGFSQAAMLPISQLRVDQLEPSDLEDWFTFTVYRDRAVDLDGGKWLTVRVVSTSTLGCLVYPLSDVEITGFEGPKCGAKYLYPPGTYMISVRHAYPKVVRQTYSIEVR